MGTHYQNQQGSRIVITLSWGEQSPMEKTCLILVLLYTLLKKMAQIYVLLSKNT